MTFNDFVKIYISPNKKFLPFTKDVFYSFGRSGLPTEKNQISGEILGNNFIKSGLPLKTNYIYFINGLFHIGVGASVIIPHNTVLIISDMTPGQKEQVKKLTKY